MKLGDLVRVIAHGDVGMLVRLVSEYDGESFWLIRWTDGTMETVRHHMLEVISENR